MILGGFSVKKAIIVLTVILCILTFSACESAPKMNGGPEVNGSVRIARNAKRYGCEVEFNEYFRPAPEAHKIKAWLSGLELQITEYPREFDDISYDLEFKQMSVLDDITELSVYTCDGEQFVWFNKELYSVKNPRALPPELTLESIRIPEDFKTVEIYRDVNDKTERFSLSSVEEAENLKAWIGNLLLKSAEPETCGTGVYVSEYYSFEFADSPDNKWTVAYRVSNNGYTLIFNNRSWYSVQNPSTPPI